jgi:hypothetical protein
VKTPQFQKLVYRRIEPAGWKQLRYPETWPDELRWIRDAFVKDWRKWTAKDQSTAGWTPSHADFALSASPRFFVAKEGQLLDTAPSQYGWQHYIQPLLTQLLGP